MPRVPLGILLGIAAGLLDILMMLPMQYPDKRSALLGALSSRFAIGFLVPNVTLPMNSIVVGGLIGLLISLPDAIITKAYAPILITGVIFGALAAWAARTWAV